MSLRPITILAHLRFDDGWETCVQLTEALDLRGGEPCWPDPLPGAIPNAPLPARADIVVIGAGIVGAMVAERLSRAGRQVALLDRRCPASGSTAASTALIFWAADVPLTHLAQRIGAARAAEAWRRVHRAVLDLAALIDEQRLSCEWLPGPELYLQGTLLDANALRAERDARGTVGLPSTFLDAAAVAERFGLAPAAALLSDDAFSVDPVALTQELLRRAAGHGATISFPIEATRIEHGDRPVVIGQHGERIVAGEVILATGYEASRLYLPPAFSIGSSYAIATRPGEAKGPNENAMVWQASESYLYLRETADGRLIVGGGDEDVIDGPARDARIGEKRGLLETSGGALLGGAPLAADCAWAANFGRSPDGLPAIGPAANAPHLWLAHAFGGNGVTFAALAAAMLQDRLEGRTPAEAPLFDPYRPLS